VFLAFGVSVSSEACAPRGPSASLAQTSASPPTTKTFSAAHAVPAHADFVASLLDVLGTRLNSPGDAFRAKAVTPLAAPTGFAVVPIGALLRGHVVAVGSLPNASLRLKFDTIDTAAGPVSLHATLSEVMPSGAVIVEQADPGELRWDVSLHAPPGVLFRSKFAGRTASSPERRFGTGKVRGDIRLTKKVQLRLVLVEPLRIDLDRR
jgi:hypothetical protein